ncbi:hypothetical protein AKJ65_01465 [candidate division MSBL1 archaeon SCGC-AAA259E19]|uniref:DUF2330 domain-containing protein n=1 Tax=candidate division MSBL1 archaeon SCGC-AAA259E19 TaxID=1698264 RepID=A0A133UN37_9EURY|nr:hypothetical protein AKJ65_01465 [candidate division MSBL1 archaeon SCGC-AAA259E19]
MKIRNIILASLFLQMLTVPFASADMGTVSVNPDVSLEEPGQRAIIAWNGEEEGMILTMHVSSGKYTKAVQFLPLPSKPKELGAASMDSFTEITELVLSRTGERGYAGGGGGISGEPEVILKRTIGPHGITVARSKDAESFVGWMNSFLENEGVSGEISLSNYRSVVEDYMVRGYEYWIIDIISLSGQKAIQPIYFRFPADNLYYPLEITSPIGGEGEVGLFLLTDGKVEGEFAQLSKAKYLKTEPEVRLEPLELEVSSSRLENIDNRLSEIFPGTKDLTLTVLSYKGDLSELDEDLKLGIADQVTSSDSFLGGELVILSIVLVGAILGILGIYKKSD